MMLKRWILPVVAAAALVAAPAHALSLRVTDSNGNTSGVLNDGGTGVINFNAPLGVWAINVTTGLGPPALSPYTFDLNSVNVSNTAAVAGFLDLELSQDNLNANEIGDLVKFLGRIGGTTQGMVTWTLFLDDTNALFGQQMAFGTDSSNAGAFADTFASSAALTDEFSITLFVRINHGNGNRVSSFDYQVQLIPEPGTLALLGAALLGLVWIRRRSRAR